MKHISTYQVLSLREIDALHAFAHANAQHGPISCVVVESTACHTHGEPKNTFQVSDWQTTVRMAGKIGTTHLMDLAYRK